MAIGEGKRYAKRLVVAAVAAASLATLAFPLAPAKAQLFFDFGPFGFGVGVAPPMPYYYPPYYAASPYYAPIYPPYYIP